MELTEFVRQGQVFIKYIEKCIDKINEIAKYYNPLNSFQDRLSLLVLAGAKVEECQQLYLDFFITYNGDPRVIIDFDYKVSCYANRLFKALKKMMEFYFKNKKRDFITDEVDQETILRAEPLLEKMLYISARWFTERQMDVWDWTKAQNKKKLPPRLPLLKDVMPCFDRVIAVKMGIQFDDGFNPKRLVVCVPPSSGKTYEANVYTDLMLAHHKIRYNETGIIRMTNTAENAYNYGSQVHKMMVDEKFAKIFPEFLNYLVNARSTPVLRMFTYESREKYLLKDCSPECSDSMFLFGSDASINGKRALLGAVMDDLSGGQGDMDNDDLHKKITDKVMSDVLDRSDDDDCPIIVMGTMYNENDVQNAFISMWNRKGLIQHPTMKSVRYTQDGSCAICLVDVEDGFGHSIAPDLYPDTKLQEKKDYFISRGKPYVYNLIYRQKKDSREPKTFADDTLMHYNWGELPEGLDGFSVSMMDLTRKNGNDFFVSGYFRKLEDENIYYLTDIIFEQKSLGLVNDPKNEFRDKVCKKIISNNTIEVCIENNTSNTTGSLLKGRCKEMGYNHCKFRERYTSRRGGVSNKTQRILNMEETIKNYIRFPNKDTLPTGHPLFLAMEQLNNWNSKDNSRKNHDDFPDMLAMFAEEFIFKTQQFGEIGGVDIGNFKNFRLF